MPAFFTGYLTAVSLILAIGAQNALVLRHGLAQSHVFAICLFCALSDAILILLGVAGFSALTTLWPSLPYWMGLFGAIFVFGYGVLRLWAAWNGGYDAELTGEVKPLRTALATIAAVTWLNPHVYLDTVALLGAISQQFALYAPRIGFAMGAVLGSFSFFFLLGYGAKALAPYMRSAKTWRILDIVIALVMFAIAFGILQKLVLA